MTLSHSDLMSCAGAPTPNLVCDAGLLWRKPKDGSVTSIVMSVKLDRLIVGTVLKQVKLVFLIDVCRSNASSIGAHAFCRCRFAENFQRQSKRVGWALIMRVIK